MRNEDWSAARVSAALARLEDSGRSQPEMARVAGISQSTVNRWARGKVRPGYDAIRKLAVSVWRGSPGLAKELVEASGYAWAEPANVPERDVLAEEFGEDKAARLRRVLGKRGEAGAAVLRALEEEFSPPGEDAGDRDASQSSRAASLARP